jgi:hypothetical protein
MSKIAFLIALALTMSSSCGAESTGHGGNLKANGAFTNYEEKSATDGKEMPESNEMPMSEENLKSVVLHASAENTNEALVISYEVENHTDQVLYLWDQLAAYPKDGPKIDKDAAYVFYQEPKTALVIRAVLPLPEAFDITKKPIPYARILAARGKLTGKIRVKHPVREYSPYYEPMTEEGSQLTKVSNVRLMIGWTPPKQGMRIEERTVGGDKVIAIRGAWAPPYQEIVQQDIPVSFDLLIYTTEFERMLPLK